MKKILIIATGGTIASKATENGLAPVASGEDLISNVPGLENKCKLDVVQLMNIDSTNMRPKHWIMIRDEIMDNYREYDGFVILHGTDTMAYTAAALSYLIQNSRKPIVITGAQKPMAHPYTDAHLNIYQSVLYALDYNSCDVSIVFNGKVVAGTRARKQRTRSFAAFESMNFPPLAYIYDDKISRHYVGSIPARNDLKTYSELNERVFVLKLTPEIKPDIFGLLFDHYDAIVLETFGIGGIPDYEDTSFENAIFNWVDSGKTIVVTTQVPEEGCDFTVYQVGKKYNDRPGIMTAGDMTTEAIVAKLMWVLGQTNERKMIEKLFNKIINNDHQEDY